MTRRYEDDPDWNLERQADQSRQSVSPGKRTLTSQIGNPRRPGHRRPRVPGKVTSTMRLPALGKTQVMIARSAAANARQPQDVPDAVISALQTEKGQPLLDWEGWSRDIGANVRDARVVTGSKAQAATEALDANAFAVGNRVFLGARHTGDQAVLRHELTHVAQQQGATMPPYSSLAITSHDDPVEREARGRVGSVSQQHEAVIARDGPEMINARAYLERFGERIAESVPTHLRRYTLPLGDPNARWKRGVIGFINALIDRLPQGCGFVWQLRPLIAPTQVEHLVDRGRHRETVTMRNETTDETYPLTTNSGRAEWFEPVAIEIASALISRLRQALPRMTQRYIEAKSQAQLRLSDTLGASTDQMPEPTELLASHPIDRLISDVFCSGEVLDVDLEGYRASDPTRDEVRPSACRQVELTVAGDRLVRAVPADATAEEVALTLYGDSAQAFRLTRAAPLWGFDHPSGMVERYRGRFSNRVVDPAQEILNSELADEAALNQASHNIGDAGSTNEILRRMRMCVLLFHDIEQSAARFGLRGLGPERDRVDQRSQQLATGDASAAAQWGFHSQRQLQILQGAAAGLNQAVAQLRSMTDLAQDAGGFSLPQYVRVLLRSLAQAYFDAAKTSHLVETASQRLNTADQQSQMYPIDLMEAILRQVQSSMAPIEESRHWGYQANLREQRAVGFRERLAVLRSQLLADPASAGESLRELHEEITALQTEAEMFATMDALNQAFTILDDTNGFWATVSFQRGDLNELEAEGRRWHRRWQAIWHMWNDGNHDEAKAMLDQLRAESGLQTYFQRVQDELQDARLAIAIGQLAALIGITIVTMGVGAYVGAAATGAGWSTGAVGVATVAAEAATFTALQTALFVEDPTIQGVVTEFGVSMATFGALRIFSHVLRGVPAVRNLTPGSRAAQVVTAGEMTGHALILGATGLARAEIERRLAGQPSLSPEEIRHIAIESLAMFVVITIVGRMARGPILLPLQRAGGVLGTKIRLANRQRAVLEAFSVEARGTRDPAVARELIRRERVAIEAEAEVYRELSRRAENDPAVLEQAGITPEQLALRLASATSRSGEMHAAEAMLSLEMLGPNHFVAPSERMPHLLRMHQRNGSNVEIVGRDPVTSETTYQVTEANGSRMRITERITEGRPGTEDVAISPEQARANNLEVAQALEIQAEREAQLAGLVDSAGVVEVSHLTVGGGVGGTVAHTTRAPTSAGAVPGADITRIPDTLTISGPEPWRARADALRAASPSGRPLLDGGRIGQRNFNFATRGLRRQAGEFNEQSDQLGRARDVANAVTMTAFETGMATYRGFVRGPIESNPGDGSWPSSKPLRVRVVSPSRGEFYIYTESIDLAMGLGPARMLRNRPAEVTNPAGEVVGELPTQVTPADHATLIADGRLVYYDAHYANPKTGRVLIVGNGPTALWNAAVALGVGARVTVLGRPEPADQRSAQAQRAAVDTEISDGSLTPRQVEARLAEIQTRLVEQTFEGARTESTAPTFDHPNLQLQPGEIRRTRPGDPNNPAEAGKIMVEIQEGRWLAFDQVAIAIGQTARGGGVSGGRPAPQGPPGPGNMIGELEMIIVDGRLVGLRSRRNPNIRVLGAAMSPQIADLVVRDQRTLYQDMLTRQTNAESVPEGSRGVPGSIYQVGQNVPLANRGSTSPPPRPEPQRGQPPIGPTRLPRQEDQACYPEDEATP